MSARRRLGISSISSAFFNRAMNPFGSVILMISAACLTLGVIHLRYWLGERKRWDILSFSVGCVSVAWVSWDELGMLRASTPEEYGRLFKWVPLPSAIMFISVV